MRLAEFLGKVPSAPPTGELPLDTFVTENFTTQVIGAGMPLEVALCVTSGLVYCLNLINEHGVPDDLQAVIHGEGI